MFAGNKNEDGVVCEEVKSVFAARAPGEEEALKLYLSNSKEFVRRWRALARYHLQATPPRPHLLPPPSSLHMAPPCTSLIFHPLTSSFTLSLFCYVL